MAKLSLFDQVFYKLEQGGMSPVYMAAAMILDPRRSPFPMDGQTVADHLAARLQQVPLMRQKLVQDPLRIGNMQRLEDGDFDIRNHIHITTIQPPGDYEELTRQLGHFVMQKLDLSRPPWRYEVIEGLSEGRIAVATQIHHSLADGLGIKEALACKWDPEPVAGEAPIALPPGNAGNTSALGLLGEAVSENLQNLYINVPSVLMKYGINQVQSSFRREQAAKARVGKKRRSPVRVPKVFRTSINSGSLSSTNRAIAYAEFPLEDIKANCRQRDYTVNDIALLMSSDALQHYFEKTGEPIDFDLVAGMAVSTRSADTGTEGNAASAVRLSLRNQIGNLDQRLNAIARDTRLIKESLAATHNPSTSSARTLVKDFAGLLSPVVLDALTYALIRSDVLAKLGLVNVALTNVPGFPDPTYLAGARLSGVIPMAPAFDGVGLTISVSSVADRLLIGLNGCADAIKDKTLPTDGLQDCYARLRPAATRQPESRGRKRILVN